MASITFTGEGPKLTGAQIVAIEGELGCKLPQDYRAFLLEHNGGKPNLRMFSVPAAYPDPVWIVFFHFMDKYLATPTESADSESVAFINHVFGTCIPANCLIIGKVVRDDLLLLHLRGERRGAIDLKVIDDEELGPPEEWAVHRERGVYPVARSFSDLLEQLAAE